MEFLLLLVVAAVAGWLLLWPVPIAPVAWRPPRAPSLDGRFAHNDRLRDVRLFARGAGQGPEDVEVDEQGRLYTGYEDGRVVRFEPDNPQPHLLARTGGRPLGLALDAEGRVVVADAYQGLLRISDESEIEVLSTEADGVPYGFTNHLDIADDGLIYFTDSSSRFDQAHQGRDAIMEHGGDGRLMQYNPATGEARVLLTGLQFANGVAVTPDQQAVLVAETGQYDILRYWRTGDRAGEHEVLIANLPGLPDNIRSNRDNRIWIALYTPRLAILDALGPWPSIRKMAFRLPRFLQPDPAPHAFVLGMTPEGTITHNLQYRAPASYHPVTGVAEHEGRLYLSSLTHDALGIHTLQDAQDTAERAS